MKYHVLIPPLVEKTLSRFPPLLKGRIRAALEAIQEDPNLGKPLKEELRGLWSYRVNRYRIVYRIVHDRIEIQIIDIGPRAMIYEKVLFLIRRSSQ